MLNMEKKNKIINLYLQGMSYINIADQMEVTRQTVSKYVKEYNSYQSKVLQATNDQQRLGIISQSYAPPKYNTSSRKRIKLTSEIQDELDKYIEENVLKIQRGHRKMIMKATDMYEALIDKGYDISYRTICNYVTNKKSKNKEAFIKSDYNAGQVCEFDWGDVALNIDELGGYTKIKLGVFTMKYSNYVYAYLYLKENTECFVDIHKRYFESIKGVPQEIVYDNAKVQVIHLAGNEKKPTEAVNTLTSYYSYNPRFTNPYSGNEKGHVEKQVDYIRRKAFSNNAHFSTLADAREALMLKVEKLNQRIKNQKTQSANALFAVELKHLLPYKLPIDYCIIKEYKVNKYSFITVGNNFYSVPDYLVDKRVGVSKDVECITVYYQDKVLFKTKRLYGRHLYQININHYISTFKKKPGAIAHSLALTQADHWLNKTFQKYYNTCPRDFVDLLKLSELYSLDLIKTIIDELVNKNIYITTALIKQEVNAKMFHTDISTIEANEEIINTCTDQLDRISQMYNQGADTWNTV